MDIDVPAGVGAPPLNAQLLEMNSSVFKLHTNQLVYILKGVMGLVSLPPLTSWLV